MLNLTNPAYFNLHGGDHKTSVNSHRVTINADRYTPTDSTLIPTGEIASLDGSALDFRTPTTIGERVLGPDSAFNYRDGYDHNYVIRRSSPDVVEAAEVYEPSTGIVMTVLTDTPGIQFFTGKSRVQQDETAPFYRSAFALEAQNYPDAPNHPDFPSAVLRPGETYRQTTVYGFSAR